MNVTPLPGCWYLDSLPTGEYAGLLPLQHQITTPFGRVPYPGDEPLWLAVTATPRFKFMGQGHETPVTYEWVGGDWAHLPVACGNWSVIYDYQGVAHIAQCAPPTGSQGWRYVALDGTLVTGDATQVSPQGLHEFTDLSIAQDGSTLVGQGPQDGQGVLVWADGQLRQLHPGACFNIRGKFNPWLDLWSISFYEVTPDGLQGWIYTGVWLELQTLPILEGGLAQPDFHFLHPVLVAPFKDPEKVAGTQYRMEDGSLGVYTENPDRYAQTVAEAEAQGTRALLGHDAIDAWTPPPTAPQHLPFIELFLVQGEVLADTVARWWRNTHALVAGLAPGQQCGVDLMFYRQFNPATGDWLWTEQEVLDGLAYVSEVVNSSGTIVVVAPFAYERANGITKNPGLAVAFARLKVAAQASGVVTLVPIPGTPEPGPQPPEPIPVPPPHGFAIPPMYSLGGHMQSEKGGIVGAGGKYGRLGPMGSSPVGGWRKMIFDGNDDQGEYEFTLTEVEPGRGVAEHTVTGCYAGQDIAVGDLTSCAYGKPKELGPAAGYEKPYLFGPVANGVKFLWVTQNPNIGVPFGCSILTWVPRT